jgi:beta-D-xylosidase 4
MLLGKLIDIEYARGCEISSHSEKDFAAAIELARSSDIVFFIGGIDHTVEREGVDRKTITLPDVQLSLIQQLEKVSRSPIHIVIMSGGGVDLSYIRDSNQSGSLIWMGYPGQSGGLALASVIFGQYNPAGRLPVTIYPASYVDAVSMFDMQMRPSPTNPGRTYKFYTGQAVYEFGYGLSYTTFNYTWNNNTSISTYSIQSLIKNHDKKERIVISLIRVNVTNTGEMDGDDVVLVYVTLPSIDNDEIVPFKQLFGFERVHLAINQTKEIFFPFTVGAALTVARDGSKWLHPGLYYITIGQHRMFSIELKGQSTQWA